MNRTFEIRVVLSCRVVLSWWGCKGNGFCLHMKMALPRYHVSFDVIEKYLRESSYPSEITAATGDNKGLQTFFYT